MVKQHAFAEIKGPDGVVSVMLQMMSQPRLKLLTSRVILHQGIKQLTDQMGLGPPHHFHRVQIKYRPVKRIAQHIRLTPLLLHPELLAQPAPEFGMQRFLLAGTEQIERFTDLPLGGQALRALQNQCFPVAQKSQL
ncbi:hypothetical protein D3C73_1267980 [compost metagenome]